MLADTLATLQALDPAILAEPVRQAQGDTTLEILDWAVQPLSHEKIIETTGGLFLFSGTGRSGTGTKPWTIVLKILNNPKERKQAPRYWSYWKREQLAFQSGMLAALPTGIRAPRCYGTMEHEEQAWLWIEYIREATGRRWVIEHFHRAARHAGRFGAAFLCGSPLPDASWLSMPFFRSIFADGDFWAEFMDPASSDNAWQSPLVQDAFPESTREGVLRIWAEKRVFWDVLDRLPQVLCHNDFHRRNLMFRTNEDAQEELMAVDWAFCGPGAVGMDMGELVATSGFFFEYEPRQVGEIEATALDGYLAGLRDGGWSGDPQLVRLGYLLSAALWMGATLPGWAAVMLPDDSGVDVQKMYGGAPETVLTGWVTLTEFLLECADEARSLIRSLKLV